MSYLRGLGLVWIAISQSILFLLEAIFCGVSHPMSDRHMACFAKRLFNMAQCELRVLHLEQLDPKQSYIYMSNHASIMDIPAMMVAVPQSLRMVAKEGLFKVPFFGAAMYKAGFIPIDRKNLEKAKLQLEQAKQKLLEGFSIWLAPEGTRSRTGELLPFKKGGFHTARALGIPIVPVYIKGAAEVVPSDTLRVNTHQNIRINFGKPISTQDLSIEELMNLVRNTIISLEQDA